MYYNSRRINYLATKPNMSLLRLARYDNGSTTKMGVFCSRKGHVLGFGNKNGGVL